MKKMIRTLAFMLAAVMCLLCAPVCVRAEESHLYTVSAWTLANDFRGVLVLYERNGEAYIDPADAKVLAGADTFSRNEDNGNLTYQFGSQKVKYDGHFVSDGRAYYPLKELMDVLKCKYMYDEGSKTLVFVPCTSFPENVLSDCLSLYRQNFDVELIKENTGELLFNTGLVMAAGFNIIGGLRIDQLWGGYDLEKYENALSGIMQGSEDENSALELLSEADLNMQRLNTMLDFYKTNWDKTKETCTLVGVDFDGVVEAYNSIGQTDLWVSAEEIDPRDQVQIGLLGVGDLIEVTQRVYASRNAAETYVNAVKVGIVDNKNEMPSKLKKAANELYKYYMENRPEVINIMQDLSAAVLENVAADTLKTYLLREMLGINNPYVEIVKLAFDLHGMSEKTNAVEMVPVCMAIQDAALARYRDSVKKKDRYGNTTGEAAVELKYGMILYLRAYQYAWEQYEFDKALRGVAYTQAEKAGESIRIMTAYDDEELMMQVDNPALDLSMEGIEPADLAQEPRQMDVNDLMPDGVYTVYMDRDALKATSEGWEFKAAEQVLLTYTDEQIDALRVGDRIIDFYDVEQISREEWGNGSVVVIGAYGFPYFHRDADSGLWILRVENDLAVQMPGAERTFYVTRGETVIYDNFSWVLGEKDMMTPVETVEECLEKDFYKYSDTVGPIEILVERGKMKSMVFQYSP